MNSVFISGTFPKISFSCFLLGDWGCDVKCSLKCLLLGCVSQGGTCDGWSHCGCNEIYNMGDITLTNDDFENLDFIELWNSIFEANDASAKILKRIKKDDNLEKYLITLLRDTYITGDDIISLLKQEYPTWKTVNSLVSLQHGWKTEIMEPGKHLQYDELDANMDKLLDLIKIVPPDDLDNSQYKLRVKNLLRNITKVEDLEEILYLVKLSGNKNLYRLVKSSLQNLGYGFEEDQDNPAGKKAILQSISVDLEDADDDEKLEVAVTKKFMPKKSNSNSSTKQKIMYSGDIDNVFSQDQTYISKGDNQNSVKTFVPNAPNPTPAHMPYNENNYYPWKTSGLPIGYNGSGNTVTGYVGYGNSISNEGLQIDTNTQASKAFILVVDANGNVVQASEIPKNVEPSLAYTPQWIA